VGQANNAVPENQQVQKSELSSSGDHVLSNGNLLASVGQRRGRSPRRPSRRPSRSRRGRGRRGCRRGSGSWPRGIRSGSLWNQTLDVSPSLAGTPRSINNTEIVRTSEGTVTPLIPAADVHAVSVQQRGAPGAAVARVGQGATVVLYALINEGNLALSARLPAALGDTLAYT